MEIKNNVSKAKLMKYFDVSQEAIEQVKAAKVDEEREDQARDVLDMVERYYSDAEYFFKKGDYVNAFAALNYAHGWLDAGARLRLFYVDDNRLFTVDGEELEFD
jgi:hypothetical protein